jgi:hypothetical protein
MRSPLLLAALPAALVLASRAAAQCELQRFVPLGAAAGDQFGTAVDVDGERAIVGGLQTLADPGYAVVLERQAGAWVETARLTASDGAPGDRFGNSVAISGERLLVGAIFDDDNGQNSGSAYVFELVAGQWVETAKLSNHDGQINDFFAVALDLDGERALIGAKSDDDVGASSGSAYVFELVAGQWVEAHKLIASDGLANELFGISVALEGDRALIGAPGELFSARGSAYVFELAGGVWVERRKLTAANGAIGDSFGARVALAGARCAIAAPLHQQLGAIYVFETQGAGWSAAAQLTPADNGAGFGFAQGLDLSDARVLAGGGSFSSGTPGVAYLFEGGAAGWRQTARLTASDAAGGDGFGGAIALRGDEALVAAPGNLAQTGAAYVLQLPQFARPYCFCPSGPCGNDDGQAGCAHAGGAGALLRACGSASLAADDLVLLASGLPAGELAVPVYARSRAVQPFGDGALCVSGPRLYRLPAGLASAGGTLIAGPGLAAYAQGAFPPAGHFLAGETTYVQLWYRAPGGPCGSGVNLSNALAITFAL